MKLTDAQKTVELYTQLRAINDLCFGSILYALIVAFAGKFCKQSSMPSINTSESLARLAVEDGGGQWVGIQEAEGMPYDFVLFNASTGSTLSLKTTEITAERVREKLVVHEEFRRANFCFVVRAAINRQQRRVQRDKHLGSGFQTRETQKSGTKRGEKIS